MILCLQNGDEIFFTNMALFGVKFWCLSVEVGGVSLGLRGGRIHDYGGGIFEEGLWGGK